MSEEEDDGCIVCGTVDPLLMAVIRLFYVRNSSAHRALYISIDLNWGKVIFSHSSMIFVVLYCVSDFQVINVMHNTVSSVFP